MVLLTVKIHDITPELIGLAYTARPQTLKSGLFNSEFDLETEDLGIIRYCHRNMEKKILRDPGNG